MDPLYKILVVDDSDAQRKALRELLLGVQGSRFDIREAADGVAALKAATEAPDVDLIITDLTMPQMDGLQLIRFLRQREELSTVPILFLTANTDDAKKAEAFKLGATDYVVKPFLAPELEARILGYLERKRAFEELQQSVEQARLTQASLLPQSPPTAEGVTLAAKYVPAEHLTGDFYDFYELSDGRLGMFIGDVSGHGIAAGLVSFLMAGVVKNNAPRISDPGEMLAHTNVMLTGKLPEKRYATACYATLDPTTKRLSFASAGHPPAILIRKAEDTVQRLSQEGSPLGFGNVDTAQYTTQHVDLTPGDRVLFQSDALLELDDGNEKKLGFAELKRFLIGASDRPLPELLDALHDHCLSVTGLPSFPDDLTLIALEVT